MILTQLEERALWIAVVLFVIIGAGLYLEHRGAAKCESDDAQVAIIQKAAQKAQEAVDAKRVHDAEEAYQNEVLANQQLRAAVPVDHVVCQSPRRESVPPASHVSQAESAPAGPLPAADAPHPQSFDPGPAADQLADEADDVLARCRELDASVPHS